MKPFVQVASGTYVTDTSVTATVPMTWGTADVLHMRAIYEAA